MSAAGRSDGVVVFDGENVSKGFAFDIDICAWKEKTDADMKELKNRLDSAERGVCSICHNGPPDSRITCGHTFCESCADRFTREAACPFRCTPNGGAAPFTPPRRVAALPLSWVLRAATIRNREKMTLLDLNLIELRK